MKESLKRKLKQRAERLANDVPAFFLAMKHPRTPWYARALAAVIVVYALSPIDLIPDFLPIIGYLDDLVLLPALIWLALKAVPREVMEDCRERAAGMWKDGKKGKWYYALPIAVIWLAAICWMIRFVRR